MTRYGACVNAYSVRTAPREQLIAELEESAVDRERVGKHERAALARAAAAKLADGEEVVFYNRCYFEVGETRRHGVMRRTRAHLIAELHDASTGWAHHGKDLLAFEARAAAGRIAAGADRVEVGHLVYEVVDGDGSDSVFTGTREEVVHEIHRQGMRAARLHAKSEERELEAAQTAIEQGSAKARACDVEYVVTGEA